MRHPKHHRGGQDESNGLDFNLLRQEAPVAAVGYNNFMYLW